MVECIGGRLEYVELTRARWDIAKPLSSNALVYSRALETSLLQPQAFCVLGRLLSLRRAHTPHTRALKTSAELWLALGPIPATACFSSQSVLTLALADSPWGLGLHDLLSLPLALRRSGGGHRYPQGQDGQQQQPGPRTPEHLETVRGETPSPEDKLPPSLAPFATCGRTPFQCLLRVDTPKKVGARGRGRGQLEGQRGRRGREKLWLQVPSPALAPGAPSPPPAKSSRRGRPSLELRGLYGTVPSRPPRGPGRRGGGTAGLPPPSGRRRRRRPRADWLGLPVTSGGLWVRREQKRC